MPAAALHVLLAAALPADNAHQNAHRGEQVEFCHRGGAAFKSKDYRSQRNPARKRLA